MCNMLRLVKTICSILGGSFFICFWFCFEYSLCCIVVHVWLIQPLKKLCHPMYFCSPNAWGRLACSESCGNVLSGPTSPSLSQAFIALSMVILSGLAVPTFIINLAILLCIVLSLQVLGFSSSGDSVVDSHILRITWDLIALDASSSNVVCWCVCYVQTSAF